MPSLTSGNPALCPLGLRSRPWLGAETYFSDTRRFKTTFEFLKLISADYGIGPKRSQTAQMDAIEEFLGASHEAAKTTLIFIDEGQRLDMASLELLRALLNYETNTEKLVQIVVSGQLEIHLLRNFVR